MINKPLKVAVAFWVTLVFTPAGDVHVFVPLEQLKIERTKSSVALVVKVLVALLVPVPEAYADTVSTLVTPRYATITVEALGLVFVKVTDDSEAEANLPNTRKAGVVLFVAINCQPVRNGSRLNGVPLDTIKSKSPAAYPAGTGTVGFAPVCTAPAPT